MKQDDYHTYMNTAKEFAKRSHAVRKKVGGVLVKDDDGIQNIISTGWNGTPAGDDNVCETVNPDGTLTTKPEVTHCELNIFGKLLNSNTPVSTKGTYLFLTLSPCFECAKLIKRAGVKQVIYEEEYRITDGITFLQQRGVDVKKYSDICGDS